MEAWRAWLRRPAALPARLLAALLAMAPLQAPQAGTLAAMLESPLASPLESPLEAPFASTLESSEHAAAHGASAQAATARADGPAPVRARHQGGFYRISGHGPVAYLLGTVHVGQASFYPLAPEAQRVLAGADHLVVELDTGANEAFAQAVARHGRYPDGGDIRKRLAPDTLARLSDALHAEGVSVASMAHLKPWLIANLLLSMRLEREGFRRSEGVEEQLLTQARRRGIKVVQLESADTQLALFDSMNDIESERYLRETLDGLADGSVLRKAGRIIEAWRTGEPAALDALLPEATAGGTTIADFTRRKLLGRRNADMAAHIDDLMTHSGGVIFVGVGLLHLLGENGLPALLAQRGYLVERVY